MCIRDRQDGDDPADVVALLSPRQATAADEVFDVRAVELWDHLEHLGDDVGGQVVGSHVDERSLARSTDRRTAQSNDHGFIHGLKYSPVRNVAISRRALRAERKPKSPRK